MPSTPRRDPRFESDSTKTALMLLASHATQDGEAGMAAMRALIRADQIDGVAYALGAAFAELAQPQRDRRRPYVNADHVGRPTLRHDSAITANSVIAAAANNHRSEADLLLRQLATREKIHVVSILLDLVLYGIRRLPPPASGRKLPT